MTDDLTLKLEIQGRDEASKSVKAVETALAAMARQAEETGKALKASLGGNLSERFASLKTEAEAFGKAMAESGEMGARALKADLAAAIELREALHGVVAEQKAMAGAAKATRAVSSSAGASEVREIRTAASARATAAATDLRAVRRRMGLMDRSAAVEARRQRDEVRATAAKARADSSATDARIRNVGRAWKMREQSEAAELRHLGAVRREREAVRRRAVTAGRHAAGHAHHAIRSLNHPVHESLGFALTAGATAGAAFAEHVVAASERFDTSMARLRMFAPQLDATEIRKTALGDSINLGVDASKIVDMIAKSVRDGVPPAIAKSLPKSIVQTAQVMGGDIERLTDSLAEGIQESTAMGWIKDQADARRFLNLEAGLSTTAGNTSEKTEQFVAAGGLGHGKEMGLDLEKTMAYGAMLNASGSRTGQASARFMGQLSQNVPKMFDKWMGSVESGKSTEESRAVTSAPQNLGYGGIREMQSSIMAGPEGLIDFATRLQSLDDKARKLVLEGYGFSEQGGAMLAELGSNGGAKGKSVLARAKELAEQKESNDYLSEKFGEWSKSLSFMLQQIEAGWRAIENEIGDTIKDDIIAPLRDWWVLVSSAIVNSNLKGQVHAAIYAFVKGLGFDDVRAMLDALSANVGGFDVAGFMKGVGEGIRAVVDQIRSLASVFGGVGGLSAETVGRIATEFLGLSVALRFVAPIVSTIGGLASAFLALRAAVQGVAFVSELSGLTGALKALVGVEMAATASGLLAFAGAFGVIAAAVQGLISVGALNKIEVPHDLSKESLDRFAWGRNPDGTSARPAWVDALSNLFGGDKAGDGLVQGPHGGLVPKGFHPTSYRGESGEDQDNWRQLMTPASYETSDSGEIARDATLETPRRVMEVRDAIDRLAAVVKASALTGAGDDAEAGGSEAGAAGGAPNLRYGKTNAGEYRGTPSGGGQGGSKVGGGSGGSRSWRNNNPGNIEYGAYAKSMGAIGTDGRFAVFPDYASGRKAQSHLLFESKTYKDLTLSGAIKKWAPASENNVPAYLAAMGANPNTRMGDFAPAQREKLLDAMQAHEGWKVGTKQNTEVTAGGGGSASGITVGGGNVGSAVDMAMRMREMGEGAAGSALGKYMHHGEWCADFVNGVFAKNGIEGTKSAMANSFNKWGHLVNPLDVKKGDVITENHGGNSPTHHVGIATGEKQFDKNGRLTAIGMISGNYGDKVTHNMERLGIIQGLHRANQATVQAADAVRSSAKSPADVAHEVVRRRNPVASDTEAPARHRSETSADAGDSATPAQGGHTFNLSFHHQVADAQEHAGHVGRAIDDVLRNRSHDIDYQAA